MTVASLASAQLSPAPAAPMASQAVPAAAPASAAHTVVILTEMTGDAAIDPHLRAATDGVLQRIRARGYEMHSPSAVGAAMPTNPQPAALRAAVGAELLVRVAVRYRDRDRAVIHLAVLSALGQRTQDITASPAEIAAAVPAAADAMLPPPGTAVPAPSPAAPQVAPMPPTPASTDRVVLRDGSIVNGRILQGVPGSFVVIATADGLQRTISWDRIAEAQSAGSLPGAAASTTLPVASVGQTAWDRRGGSLFTFDVQALIVGVLESRTTIVDKTFTSGETMRFTGTGNAGGGGGGLGFHLGYLYLGAPDVAKGNTWAGFRVGTGLELAMAAYGHRNDSKIQAGLRDSSGKVLIPGTASGGDTTWTSTTLVMVPLTLGGQFGFGKFWNGSRWNGTQLGIDWRPTYYRSKPGDLEPTSGVNPAGMQLTLDVGSLEAGSKLESNFRMAVTLLPPVSDHPTVLTLGFGAGWY